MQKPQQAEKQPEHCRTCGNTRQVTKKEKVGGTTIVKAVRCPDCSPMKTGRGEYLTK